MTIPYPRAPTGRTKLRIHQLLCFVDLHTPRRGADHFTHIPGCQVAPFAFTVSPVGAKINEKIFEKRSILQACAPLCGLHREWIISTTHTREAPSALRATESTENGNHSVTSADISGTSSWFNWSNHVHSKLNDSNAVAGSGNGSRHSNRLHRSSCSCAAGCC